MSFEPMLAYRIILFIFIALSFYLFQKTEFAAYIYVLFALTITGKISETRRNEFLKTTFGETKFRQIRVIENFLLTLPFLLFLLFEQRFLSASILILLTTILALANFQTNISFTLWTPFSKKAFEFSAGFRNSFYLIIAAYVLTIIALFVNNFNLGVFVMLLVFTITLG